MKEEIVKGIMSQGYDAMTSFEMATNAIEQFKAQKENSMTFHVQKYSFTIKRK